MKAYKSKIPETTVTVRTITPALNPAPENKKKFPCHVTLFIGPFPSLFRKQLPTLAPKSPDLHWKQFLNSLETDNTFVCSSLLCL